MLLHGVLRFESAKRVLCVHPVGSVHKTVHGVGVAFDRAVSQKITSLLWLLSVVAILTCASVSQATPPAPAPVLRNSDGSPSLLNEVGKLFQHISDAQIQQWRNQLYTGSATASEAARLHLWLGEIEVARNREPKPAYWHFNQVTRLTHPQDPLYSTALYDSAMTLFFQGAYQKAAPAFHTLLQQRDLNFGRRLPCVALWYRHAIACKGYHEERSRLGITEPTELDPYCGVAALACCFRAHHRHYDKKSLLAKMHITGFGNSMQDLIDATRKLGMDAVAVIADRAALIALPKPLIAYVEHDHFVAVVRADQSGVTYVCSDCGPWPGGEIKLTWKQWHAMDCDLYVAVTPKESDASHLLKQLPVTPGIGSAAKPTGKIAQCALPLQQSHLLRSLALHAFLYEAPCNDVCAEPPAACHCPPAQCCPLDGSGPDNGGPTHHDPVNLATGEEEYNPDPDLVVYNPIGPSVVWQRQYMSLRGPYQVPPGNIPYQQFALGLGWNTRYDMQVLISADNSQVFLMMPNGGAYVFNPPLDATNTPIIPSPDNPEVDCAPGSAGVPMLCRWIWNSDGSTSVFITTTDRTQLEFSSANGFALTTQTDRNGNALHFLYTTPALGPGYRLAAIQDDNGQALLTLHYNSQNRLTSVSDRYRRSIYYQSQRYVLTGNISPYQQFTDELVQVSQPVHTGAINRPFRYIYGYTYISYGHLATALGTITVPSPTGHDSSTMRLSYNSYFVSRIVDGNRNSRNYGIMDATHTIVGYSDKRGGSAYGYVSGFDSQMRTVTRTDGTGSTVVFTAGYGSTNAYQPSTVTNGNGQTTTYVYDPFGQVASMTSPRNVQTVYTRDYTTFPFGELTEVQTGTKIPIQFSYFEPSGLLQTMTVPAPGATSANGAATVTTSFTYDGLGNITGVQAPGNRVSPTITTTLNYTQDGNYTQPAAIGQPLTITDNLGHTRHLRYDAQGNLTADTDALGLRTCYRYNIANQLLQTIAPPVGDITGALSVAKSTLTSNPDGSYSVTITLTNTGTTTLTGNLLVALTNLAPGVQLLNAQGTYVNSPYLSTSALTLAPGGTVSLPVSFKAASASAVNYGVQVYLVDSTGTPLANGVIQGSMYLYPGGPLLATNRYDEAGTRVRTIFYTYGKEGELLARTGSTEPVAYTYDAYYRMVSLADGNRHVTLYAYNPAGWLAGITYPRGDSVQYTAYDAQGNVLTRIDGRGIETDYTYNDPESLLTGISYVNNAAYNTTLGYDSYGRRNDVLDGSGHHQFAYDDGNQLAGTQTTYAGPGGKSLPTVALTYTFNPDGSRNAMTIAGIGNPLQFHYGYDAAGRMTLLTNPYGEKTQWSYLNNNGLQSQVLANGVSTTYAYNARGLLNDLTNYGPTGALLSDFGAMTYDAPGNRLMTVANLPAAPATYSGTTSYQYDGRDQLITEQSTRAGGYKNGFIYDPAGNPLMFKGNSNAFNTDNQFANPGFNYDGNGNPTLYRGKTLSYDPENRLTAYGSAMSAGYRADGLRAWKKTANGTTYFLYDGITPTCEIDGQGNIAAINTFAPGGLLSRYSSSSNMFCTFDPQGSLAQGIDSTGNITSNRMSDAFGTTTSTVTPAGPISYGGQYGYYTDNETGIQLLGHRYYDPGVGRFITRDPIGYLGGTNLYSYTSNHTLNAIDPSGLDVIITVGIGGGLGPGFGEIGGGYGFGYNGVTVFPYGTGGAAYNPIGKNGWGPSASLGWGDVCSGFNGLSNTWNLGPFTITMNHDYHGISFSPTAWGFGSGGSNTVIGTPGFIPFLDGPPPPRPNPRPGPRPDGAAIE